MEKLVELWILRESGVCMFHHTTDENVDPNLFGSFFTAIKQLGQRCSNAEIDGIMMQDSLLMSVNNKEYGISIVGRTQHRSMRKNMKKILHEIGQNFVNEFPGDSIKKFNGNIDQFESFEVILKPYMHFDEILIEHMKGIF